MHFRVSEVVRERSGFSEKICGKFEHFLIYIVKDSTKWSNIGMQQTARYAGTLDTKFKILD